MELVNSGLALLTATSVAELRAESLMLKLTLTDLTSFLSALIVEERKSKLEPQECLG